MTNNEKYNEFREKYPIFRYKSFELAEDGSFIFIKYHFETDGLSEFFPTIKISKKNLKILNKFDSDTGRAIVFSLGMVEAVSYLKITGSPLMKVECGKLGDDDVNFWKKLYYKGLGEYFYRNGIDVSFSEFLTIESGGEDLYYLSKENEKNKINITPDASLVPVGGGKDSAVTAELVKKHGGRCLFFTVNDQKARTDTVLRAGYSENDIVRTERTLSPEMLELNKRGFLNGHTPFSAIVAFLSYYAAYLTGSENIVLSNESSANSGNLTGLEINHQYSKSYEFEIDFRNYCISHFTDKISYFSILRPFSELQIASYFASFPKYHDVFRSCNRGSKKNVWCCGCAKCLFVFSMMSAFLSPEKVTDIFGENLFEKASLKDDFEGLTGINPVKPFECVGTSSETKYALAMAVKKYYGTDKDKLPYLMKIFVQNFNTDEILKENPFKNFNNKNNIPDKFLPEVKEMYDYVGRHSCKIS